MVSKTEHAHRLNRKRAHTPHSLAKSDKGITDTAKLKREAEAKSAASAWLKGMDRETRLK